MSAHRIVIVCGCVWWLFCAATASHAQSAAEWQALQTAASTKSDKIMAEAKGHKRLLGQYMVMRQAYASDNSPAFRLIFGQYVSWYQSFLGDYPDAMKSFSIAQSPQQDDSPSPLTDGSYAARPAVTAIPQLAKSYRVVLFNEAHNIVLTRSLTVQLLQALHEEGFNYFAAETLVQSDTGLASRGYATDDSGFYTEEPIYAEMVRTALKLGFKVIAYEATSSNASGDAREAEQARHIYEQVFAHDPHARLIVNAGYEHIVKSGDYLGGSSMAEHLYKLIQVPMLSVEQTMMYPHPSEHDDHPYYVAVMKQLRPDAPIVFVNASGKPWALRSAYDVNVFFPPEQMVRGRPTWLSLGGMRRAYRIDAGNCGGHYPCLVEARYSNEGADAIPADRVVLDQVPLSVSASQIALYSSTQGIPSSDLYLRPGKYALDFIGGNDRILHKEELVVPPSSEKPN